MECGYARLAVFFEDPFWIGLYEREDGGTLEVCKAVFGAEPRDVQVYQWLLEQWRGLVFSPGVPAAAHRRREGNPKRRRREAARLREGGIGTKAQQALQAQREQNKTQRQAGRRDRDAQAEARRFALRREKKKQKRRGH